MVDWFNVLSIQNILLFTVGFLIGRFWKLIKKTIRFMSGEIENEKGTNKNKI